MIQNKVPPKLGDPESFLIPYTFSKAFSCNALADIGASINLMPYSLYAKLSLEALKPTKMSVRLADRSFQHPIGIADNMRIEVATFQRCILAIFHDMIEEFVEVFMDDFSVFGNSFDKCLNNLDKILQRCKDANLFLNWEKCHFMVEEGIMLGHKVSGACLEVDKAKIDIENDEASDDSDVDENFPGETLMEITTRDIPWFADFANYLVAENSTEYSKSSVSDHMLLLFHSYKSSTLQSQTIRDLDLHHERNLEEIVDVDIEEVGHKLANSNDCFSNEEVLYGEWKGESELNETNPIRSWKERYRIRNVCWTMDDGVVNWGEHTVEEEETNHALMAISSNNEVTRKQIILAYTLMRIGMKAVKEKEQLQKIVDSWKNSSKNLWKLVDSGMTSNSKVGLGYEIQSNNEVLSYEEEMNRTVFKCTEEDFLNKPLYSRFSKTDNFKGVPHPLTGDLLLNHKRKLMIHFPVQLNAIRSNVNTVRANVNFVRQNVNSVRTNINTVRSKQPVPTNNTNSFSPVRPPLLNKFYLRSHFSNQHSPVRRPIVRNTSRMTYSHVVKGNLSMLLRTMQDSIQLWNMRSEEYLIVDAQGK
ncbi:reverse transcriptase domain-containing protein [Tanacetum coccineum]